MRRALLILLGMLINGIVFGITIDYFNKLNAWWKKWLFVFGMVVFTWIIFIIVYHNGIK